MRVVFLFLLFLSVSFAHDNVTISWVPKTFMVPPEPSSIHFYDRVHFHMTPKHHLGVTQYTVSFQEFYEAFADLVETVQMLKQRVKELEN